MRVLHTADWHLGQSFFGLSREAEHRVFLGWLVELIAVKKIDALVIAGDIFDAANPPVAAIKMWYEFVAEAHKNRPTLDIVAVAGNHDSPARLEMAQAFHQAFRLHVIGRLPRHPETRAIEAERILVPLSDADGAVRAWCAAVPYLRPADLDSPDLQKPSSTHRDAADDAENWAQIGVRGVYETIVAHAQTRRESAHPLLATGHFQLHGATPTPTSERMIPVGTDSPIDVAVFPDAATYVALGHLHMAQWRDDRATRIRYCGSPLPLSMAEASYPPHSVTLLEFSGDEIAAAEELPTPRTVELVRIPTTDAAPLETVLAEISALPTGRDLPRDRWPYLAVHVHLERAMPDLRTRIESHVAKKPVRLVSIRADIENARALWATKGDLRQMRPEDVFRRLYGEKAGNSDTVPEPLMQEFLAVLDEVLQATSPDEE